MQGVKLRESVCVREQTAVGKVAGHQTRVAVEPARPRSGRRRVQLLQLLQALQHLQVVQRPGVWVVWAVWVVRVVRVVRAELATTSGQAARRGEVLQQGEWQPGLLLLVLCLLVLRVWRLRV